MRFLFAALLCLWTLPAFAQTAVLPNFRIPTGNAAEVGAMTPQVLVGVTGTVVAVKTTAGYLGVVQCDNPNAAWTYLQIFNKIVANVSLGSTAPDYVLPLASSLSNGFVIPLVNLRFSTAISVAATTTVNGSTSPATAAINCSFGVN